jgi:hypothetical protein
VWFVGYNCGVLIHVSMNGDIIFWSKKDKIQLPRETRLSDLMFILCQRNGYLLK